MNPQFILAITQMVMDVLERHAGPRPTPEEVAALINKELAEGQTIIAEWFIKKGLPPPQ